MKKLFTLAVFTAISVYTYAQDVNKLIRQEDVTRIISTLASDGMQGRATFTPGIEKAAKFIESEYKQIGLQPMKGDDGYRQNFTMVKTMTSKLDVTINGTAIAQENVAVSGSSSFTWSQLADAEIMKVTPDKDLRAAYISALQSNKNMLVLIDPKFSDMFKRVRGRSLGGSVTFKTEQKDSHALVFVLGAYDDVKTFTDNGEGKSQELPVFNRAGISHGKT